MNPRFFLTLTIIIPLSVAILLLIIGTGLHLPWPAYFVIGAACGCFGAALAERLPRWASPRLQSAAP